LKPQATEAILNTLRMMGSQVSQMYVCLLFFNRWPQVVFSVFGWVLITGSLRNECLLIIYHSIAGGLLLLLAFVVFTVVLPAYGVYEDIFWYPIFVKILIWNNGPGVLVMLIIVVTFNRMLVRMFFQVSTKCFCLESNTDNKPETRQLRRDSKSSLLCKL
jgi:hypothetical protein